MVKQQSATRANNMQLLGLIDIHYLVPPYSMVNMQNTVNRN